MRQATVDDLDAVMQLIRIDSICAGNAPKV